MYISAARINLKTSLIMNYLPIAICGRLKISLRIDESAFQKFHQNYENFIKTANFLKFFENLKFMAPMRPTKYKIFAREEFSILKSCWTVNHLMDSTENSIENESFEIFENFKVLNRVWEIESFLKRFKSFILEVTFG